MFIGKEVFGVKGEENNVIVGNGARAKSAFWHKLLPLIGLLILCFVIWHIGPSKIVRALAELNYRLLLPLPALIVSVLVVQVVKWQLILCSQEIDVSFGALFRSNLIGVFYGALTPGRVGMLIKVRYLASFAKRPVNDLISAMVIDKLMELVTLGCFSTVSAVVLARTLNWAVFALVLAATGGFVLLLFALFPKSAPGRIVGGILRAVIPRTWRQSLKERIQLVHDTMPTVRALVFPGLLSLFCWLLIWTQTYVVARALGIDIGYGLFIVAVPLGALVSLIPITVSGVGTRELTLAGLFSVFGVPPERTVLMSLLSMVLCMYPPALLGALLATRTLNSEQPEVTNGNKDCQQKK
ncbi:MAG: lysylphosphatidylglycerol synthase transmembrane domain-containing protein [Pseudomonadota bacterium]